MDNYQLVYSKTAIAQRISEIAPHISAWAQQVESSSGRQLLALCILRGGVHFFSDILRSINVSVEPGFCRAASYDYASNTQTHGELEITFAHNDWKDRAVLVVDDICETGKTLATLERNLINHGVSEVRTLVLIHRQQEGQLVSPHWSGFSTPSKRWFVGYGLDDRNRYANLPDIYEIVASSPTQQSAKI